MFNSYAKFLKFPPGLESFHRYKLLVVVKALKQNGYCNIKFPLHHIFKGDGKKV